MDRKVAAPAQCPIAPVAAVKAAKRTNIHKQIANSIPWKRAASQTMLRI